MMDALLFGILPQDKYSEFLLGTSVPSAQSGRVMLWMYPNYFSWSANGRYLASSSLDWNLKVWDMVSGNHVFSKTFDSMLLKVEFHPKSKWVYPINFSDLLSDTVIVSIWMMQPRILNINTKQMKPLVTDEKDDNPSVRTFPLVPHWSCQNECLSTHTIAQFNTSGDNIYIGTNEGMITVLESTSLKVSYHVGPQIHFVGQKEFFDCWRVFKCQSRHQIICF